jgi:hypothetical protein
MGSICLIGSRTALARRPLKCTSHLFSHRPNSDVEAGAAGA